MRTTTGSKLLSETSMLSDRCVRVRETGRHAETLVDEPENGPIIAVDDNGLVEPIAATVAPSNGPALMAPTGFEPVFAVRHAPSQFDSPVARC